MSLRTSIRTAVHATCHAAVALATVAAFATVPQVRTLFFSQAGILTTDTTTLNVLIGTDIAGPLVGGNFTLSYPGLLNVGTSSTDCGGTPVSPAGGNTVSLSGINIAAGAQCLIRVDVKPVGPGQVDVLIPLSAFSVGALQSAPAGPVTLCANAPLVVTSAADSGAGTLRAALTAAGTSTCSSPFVLPPNKITFSLPAATINVLTPLPLIPQNGPITIDGGGVTELNGAACTGCAGLQINNFSATLSNLAIYSFSPNIQIGDASNFGFATITGSHIGVGWSGGARPGNGAGIAVANGGVDVISSLVQGNTVGVDSTGGVTIDGSIVRNNSGAGALLDNAGGQITNSTFTGNGGAGIAVVGNGGGIFFSNNIAFGNGGPGIDLGNDGFTPNAARGAYQSFPEFTAAFDGIDTVINGRVDALPTDEVTLQFYDNAAPTTTITGGQSVIGAFPVTVDATGAFPTLRLPGRHANISALAIVGCLGECQVFTSEYSPTVSLLTLPDVRIVAPASVPAGSSFAVTLTGTSTATVNQVVSVNATLPAGFTITAPIATNCPSGTNAASGSTISSGNSVLIVSGSCTLAGAQVTAPTAPGTYTITIPVGGVVMSTPAALANDTAIAATITVTPATTGPALSITPPSVTFPDTPLGGSSTVQLTLHNPGSAPLTLGAPSLAGGPFAFASKCPATIAPGGSCTIDVIFRPTTTTAGAGSQGTTFVVPSDAPGGPQTVPLLGFGSIPPQVQIVAPASLVAGSTGTVSIAVLNGNGGGSAYSGLAATMQVPSGFTLGATSPPTCAGAASSIAAGALVGSGGSAAPGVSCTIATAQVTAPATPGSYIFVIPAGAFSMGAPYGFTNSGDIAFTVAVTLPLPALDLVPSSLDFGNQDVGTTSAPRTVTLTNRGANAVTLGVPAASSPFQATATTCGSTVAPGASCTITVVFGPTAAGPFNATLNFTANGSAVTVPLSGTGVVPTITLTPPAVTFPARSVGTVSPAVTITVGNPGSGTLLLSGIAISGDYSFTSTCSGSVPAAGSCTIDVRFGPLLPGARNGVLTITSNAAGSPHTVTLTGTGLAPPSGTLSLSPGSLEFAPQAVGTTSEVHTITVTNTGNAAVTFAAVLNGPFANGPVPAALTPCVGVLNPGSACSIAITFTPVGAGTASGVLQVSSDASNPVVAVALVGTGDAPGAGRALQLTDRLEFGSQPLGLRSAGLPLTLTNTSTADVAITDLTVSGDFSASDVCAVVPARGSCTLLVFLTPQARGDRNGLLTLRAFGESQPYIVALSGNGGANPVPVMTVTPLLIGFGNAIVGPPVVTQPVTLINVGEVPVTLGALTAPGDFLVDSHCGATIPVGGRCTLDVSFYPRLPGLRAGVLGIGSDAGNGPHHVDLTGVGCALPNVARSRIPQLTCAP